MTTTPPAGSEKWTAEQREVWRKLVEAEPIKALSPEFREALSAFAACLVETPYPFVTDRHRGGGEVAGKSGGSAKVDWWPLGDLKFSGDPEEHNRKAVEFARASRSFDETFRRFAAEEEARLLWLALQCLGKAVADRKPDPPPAPTLLGSLDDLVSSLRPSAEGVTLRVSREVFERITWAGQEELRRRGAVMVDHPYSEPKSGLLVAYYNGVRIEAEP